MDRQEQLIELCKELRLPSTSGSRFNKVSNSKTADVFHLNLPPRSSNSFFVFLYSLIIFLLNYVLFSNQHYGIHWVGKTFS